MSDDRHLILIGMMGAGKTTVGAHCATLLGRRFVDIDDLVTEFAGITVAEIFAADGEPGFRALERSAVHEACASSESLVISCGGGAVLDPANRDSLRAAGLVVWLRADAAVLARRLRHEVTGRPLLAGDDDTAARLAELSEERAGAYEETAHLVVDTGDRDLDGVCSAVLEELDR